MTTRERMARALFTAYAAAVWQVPALTWEKAPTLHARFFAMADDALALVREERDVWERGLRAVIREQTRALDSTRARAAGTSAAMTPHEMGERILDQENEIAALKSSRNAWERTAELAQQRAEAAELDLAQAWAALHAAADEFYEDTPAYRGWYDRHRHAVRAALAAPGEPT